MKIALLVCGQIRGSVKNIFTNLNKNLVDTNVDVFISSWKQSLPVTKRGVVQRTKNVNSSTTQSDIFGRYLNNIVDVSLYDDIDLVDKFNMHQSRYESTGQHSSHGLLYQQFLTVNAIEKLKKYELKKNITYDGIARVRPDLMFQNTINYELGNIICLGGNTTNEFQASDKFFYGNRERFIYFIKCLQAYIQNIITTPIETDPLDWHQKPIGERLYRQVLNYYKIPNKVILNNKTWINRK